MIVKNLRKHSQGSLIAFFDLVVPKWGNFYIKGVKLFQKGSQKWISLPSNCVEKDGEKVYYPINGFEDKEILKKFELLVLDAVNPLMAEDSQQEVPEDDFPF